jgi:hypothetical protein
MYVCMSQTWCITCCSSISMHACMHLKCCCMMPTQVCLVCMCTKTYRCIHACIPKYPPRMLPRVHRVCTYMHTFIHAYTCNMHKYIQIPRCSPEKATTIYLHINIHIHTHTHIPKCPLGMLRQVHLVYSIFVRDVEKSALGHCCMYGMFYICYVMCMHCMYACMHACYACV